MGHRKRVLYCHATVHRDYAGPVMKVSCLSVNKVRDGGADLGLDPRPDMRLSRNFVVIRGKNVNVFY